VNAPAAPYRHDQTPTLQQRLRLGPDCLIGGHAADSCVDS
jgi:hypothetical protein